MGFRTEATTAGGIGVAPARIDTDEAGRGGTAEALGAAADKDPEADGSGVDLLSVHPPSATASPEVPARTAAAEIRARDVMAPPRNEAPSTTELSWIDEVARQDEERARADGAQDFVTAPMAAWSRLSGTIPRASTKSPAMTSAAGTAPLRVGLATGAPVAGSRMYMYTMTLR